MNGVPLLVLALIVTIAGMILALRRYQHTQLFQPTPSSTPLAPNPGNLQLDFEDVVIDGPDGKAIYGWWLPCSPDASTVLFLHGNRGNLSDRIDSLALYRGMGLNVFGIDYRGYGRSPGTPSEPGLYADAHAAWRYLIDTRNLRENDVIILGRSLGGAVASKLASKTHAGAVIIESTFTSIPTLAKEAFPHLPAIGLTRIHFDNLSRIADITAPLLLFHSREDEVIGFHHGEALAAAARAGTRFVEISGAHSGGHLTSGEAYTKPLHKFLLDSGMRLVGS